MANGGLANGETVDDESEVGAMVRCHLNVDLLLFVCVYCSQYYSTYLLSQDSLRRCLCRWLLGVGLVATGPGLVATGPGLVATGPGLVATGPGLAATGPGLDPPTPARA